MTVEYESVRILRLQPGDIVVARTTEHVTAYEAALVRDVLRPKFPDHEVLVIGPNVEIEVVRTLDADIRCDATNPTGQCLDHQGHLGDHQWPAENGVRT